MFFEGNDVLLPTDYGRSIVYQAAPVIDRLSPREEETGHYTYCTTSSSSLNLMSLGQENCPPSTFGLFTGDAAKLLNLLVVSCSDFFN